VLPRNDLVGGIAAAVLVVGGTYLVARAQDSSQAVDLGAVGLIVVAGLALGWRRRAPVGVLAVVVVAVAGYLLLGYPYGPIQLCMVYAMYEVARLRQLKVSLVAVAGAIVVSTAAQLSRSVLHANEPALLAALWASWLLVPWAVGSLVQVRSGAIRRSRKELAARAALEERTRVAREVHDIAGHSFSAVAMQAGVALLVFEEDPAQAKMSLEAIQSTSTQALAELRALLDAFQRTTEGLPAVGVLVDHVRAAGLPVRLSMDSLDVPEEIGGVAYRVLQEALTNVLRHAGPTSAEVTVRREADHLLVAVSDRGTGTPELAPGLGLTGMRNRVAAVGGELSLGNRSGGGFSVSARLPLGGDR
jgi:signal transduction histidine kinase